MARNSWTPNRRMMGNRSDEQPTGKNKKKQGKPGQISTRYGLLEGITPANQEYLGTAPRVTYPTGAGAPYPVGTAPPAGTITRAAGTVAPTGTTVTPSTGANLQGGAVTPAALPNAGLPQTAGGTNIMDPFNNFAAPFAPTAAPMIFENPQIMLMQAMANMGYDPNANMGLFKMAEPYTDYLNALATLSLGGGADFGAGGNEAMINWMGNALQQGLTPGGQAIDFNAGLAALNAGATAPGSVIGKYLGSEDPATQVSRYQQLALPLAAASLHPVFARAFQNMLDQQGDQYLYNMAGPNMAAGGGQFGAFVSPTLGF